MTTKEAFDIIEAIMAYRVTRMTDGVNALSEMSFDIDVSVALEKIKTEREALRIFRQQMRPR